MRSIIAVNPKINPSIVVLKNDFFLAYTRNVRIVEAIATVRIRFFALFTIFDGAGLNVICPMLTK